MRRTAQVLHRLHAVCVSRSIIQLSRLYQALKRLPLKSLPRISLKRKLGGSLISLSWINVAPKKRKRMEKVGDWLIGEMSGTIFLQITQYQIRYEVGGSWSSYSRQVYDVLSQKYLSHPTVVVILAREATLGYYFHPNFIGSSPPFHQVGKVEAEFPYLCYSFNPPRVWIRNLGRKDLELFRLRNPQFL